MRIQPSSLTGSLATDSSSCAMATAWFPGVGSGSVNAAPRADPAHTRRLVQATDRNGRANTDVRDEDGRPRCSLAPASFLTNSGRETWGNRTWRRGWEARVGVPASLPRFASSHVSDRRCRGRHARPPSQLTCSSRESSSGVSRPLSLRPGVGRSRPRCPRYSLSRVGWAG